MNKFLAVLFLLCGSVAFAQVPNCQINFGPWTDTNQSPPSFNGQTNCAYWVLSYQVTGFSAISLRFDSATGTTGAPGTFGAFSGSISSGINPNTSTTCSTPTNCTTTFTGVVGWYKVNFTSHTGSGTIQGTLQGYKTGVVLGGNPVSTGGCPGTVATPCIVAGPTAVGAAPSTNPVLVAGLDGTNVRNILLDTSGRLINVGAAAAGAAIAGAPVGVGVSDGTNAQFVHSASLANMPTSRTTTVVNSLGAELHEKGSRIALTNSSSVSGTATITLAAETGVRHVLDCLGWSDATFGAVTGNAVTIVVRDGLTGAGTILWGFTLTLPTATGVGLGGIPATVFCGVNLVGTTNTAMTIEFTGANANMAETVNATIFNVN